MTLSFHHTICGHAILSVLLSLCLYCTMYVCPPLRGVEVSIHVDCAVSGAALVMCCYDNNLASEYGIQPLVPSGKGCIVDPHLFESEQSTHDIFCHFPQWNYDCRGALHHQIDCHPSFLHQSLVLGYL